MQRAACPSSLSPQLLSMLPWELSRPGRFCCFAELDCLPQSQSRSESEIVGDSWRDGAGRRRPGQGCPKSLPLCPGPQQQPPSAKPGTFYSGAPQQNSCLFVTPKRQRPQYPSVAGKAGAEGGCQETSVQRQPCEETGRDEREEGYPRQTLKSSRGGWQAPASSLTMPAHR